MKVYAFVCIILGLCVAASLQETPHSPCEDGPLPISLKVEGCNESPCKLRRGSDLVAEWDFKAMNKITKLTTHVEVTVAGSTITYPFPQPDACKSLTNGECPLQKDDKVTYNLKMPISPGYPLVQLKISFALIDQDGKSQVCFKLNCQVTKS